MKRSTLAIAVISLLTSSLSGHAEAQQFQQRSQRQQFHQFDGNGTTGTQWQYGVQGGQPVSDQQQYRWGANIPGSQTYQYGVNSGTHWTYQSGNGGVPANKGRQYQIDPRHTTGLQWGEWKPVNRTSETNAPNCTLPGQGARITNQQSAGRTTSSGRRITVSGGTDSRLGSGSTVGTNNGDQTGSTTTTRRRRSTFFGTNQGTATTSGNADDFGSTGTVAGKTADGFQAGSVGGP